MQNSTICALIKFHGTWIIVLVTLFTPNKSHFPNHILINAFNLRDKVVRDRARKFESVLGDLTSLAHLQSLFKDGFSFAILVFP